MRMKLTEVLNLYSTFFRDILVNNVNSENTAQKETGSTLLNRDCAGLVRKSSLSAKAALAVLEHIDKCRFYIDRNVNYRIAIRNFFLNVNAVYRQG